MPQGDPLMNDKETVGAASLYELDETAWLEQTAELITQGRWNEIDRGQLSEYLVDMARRDKREVFSRLTVMLAHRLKWEFQTARRTKSWLRTMVVQSSELEQLLESQFLRQYAASVYEKAYARAAERAAVETGLKASDFPPPSPWPLDVALKAPEAE